MRHLVMLFFILSLLACQEQKNNKAATSNRYSTLTVEPSNAILETTYPCVIKGKQSVEIRPQISGKITEICIDEGATVKKGDILFVIDQIPYKAALASAEENVKLAEAQLNTAVLTAENKKILYGEEVISEYDLQTSVNELEVAKATLAQALEEVVNARNNLAYTILRSPVDGICGMIPYRIGTLVGATSEKPLVTVSNMDEMYAYFSITESQLLDMMQKDSIYTGQAVSLTLSNGCKYNESGLVSAVSGTIESESGVISIRVTFPNPQGMLHNNGSGIISIPEYRNNCLIIPVGATYEVQDHVYVYKVVDGKTCSTPVSVTRMSDGKHCIVEQGLAPGDVIIAEGAGLLREGMEVES